MNLTKHHHRLSPPSLKDNTATIDRLLKALRKETGHWPLAPRRRLAEFARTMTEADYQVTATLAPGPAGPVLVGVEPGDSTDRPAPAEWGTRVQEVPPGLWEARGLGLALDIGSTHLQATLHDLGDQGRELAAGNCLNPQTSTGADILTRIQATTKPGELERLHRELVEAAGGLAAELCQRAGRRTGELAALVAAGNTTMTHFFLGLPVAGICREPYIPVVNRPAPFFTAELGLEWAPEAVGWCLPNVGSYFGGDLVAGIVAADLHRREEVAILVDVGTNAEVVLGNRDWLVACAGAAGPALEGGVAKTGILAQPGAIEGVSIDPESKEPRLKIIPAPDGSTPPPKGLCGSGLLQLVAQLYLTRVIDMRGKIILPTSHTHIVQTEYEGLAYLVVPANESATGEPILITETEIDILLRSKAAMYTILRTVLLEVGLEFEDLSAFFVAGAFGNVIDPETAITLGMLPDLPRERFIALGNSSLKGCQLLLRDPGGRREVEAVADKLTYIELNVNQALMNRFSAARFIPHTDHTRFPSVPVFFR